jgi:hypothetical protein
MALDTLKSDLSSRLECSLRTPGDLSLGERAAMFGLMADYYQQVRQDDFERDLDEKEWVIVTSEAQRGVLGFTTLTRIHALVNGMPVTALFSGDTVLAPDIWGARGWARVWGRHAAALMRDMPESPLYWLLLTATHRTYRFLPTFLREFYPRPGVETPKVMREITDVLARARFAQAYDPQRGIVHIERPLQVRNDFVELATQGLDDEHGQFFAARNPNFLAGDYLVCIGDLTEENHTRLGRKFFSLT